MDVATTIPKCVSSNLFGENKLKGAYSEDNSGSLLKYKALSEIPGSDHFRNELGTKYVKLSKHKSKLPFSLIASKTDSKADIFVHVPSQNKKENYPGLLGKGWYADTEIAQNLRSREWVAVKCYKHTKADRIIPQELIDKEIKVLKIIGAYKGYCEYKDKDGNVKRNVYMKMFDGKDLKVISKNELPNKLSKRIGCAISALKDLETLHKKNWIHGDIHRGNIILDNKANALHLIDLNKSETLNDKKEAKVIKGGYKLNIPGSVRENLDINDCMTLNKFTDRFALGTTLAFMFNERAHPTKNNDGYVDSLLVDQAKLSKKLCDSHSWNKLNRILCKLTDKDNGSSDLSQIIKKLEGLMVKLQG